MAIILDDPGTKFARADGSIPISSTAEVVLTAHAWLAAPSATKSTMPAVSIGMSAGSPAQSMLLNATTDAAPWTLTVQAVTTASTRKTNGVGGVIPASAWYLMRSYMLWDGGENPAVILETNDTPRSTTPLTTDLPPFSFDRIDVGLDQPATTSRQADGLKVAYAGVFVITGADAGEIATRRTAVLAALKTMRPQAVSVAGATLVAADTFIAGDRDPVGLTFTVNGSAVVDGDGPTLSGGGGSSGDGSEARAMWLMRTMAGWRRRLDGLWLPGLAPA